MMNYKPTRLGNKEWDYFVILETFQLEFSLLYFHPSL